MTFSYFLLPGFPGQSVQNMNALYLENFISSFGSCAIFGYCFSIHQMFSEFLEETDFNQ